MWRWLVGLAFAAGCATTGLPRCDEKAAWDALNEALRRAAENPSIRLMDKLQGRRGEHSGHT